MRSAAATAAPRSTARPRPPVLTRLDLASALTALAAALLGACASAPREPAPAPDAADTQVVRPAERATAAAPAARSAHPRAGNAPFYEVMGRRYQVLPASAGYSERGVASWYGRKFHGRPTASGEIYDMHALTAAHKTLPIPCYVRVRNLANGREVVVRVNDRGPFVKNRLIDLSYEAARRLEVVGPGTALVEVTVIDGPGAPGAPAATLARAGGAAPTAATGAVPVTTASAMTLAATVDTSMPGPSGGFSPVLAGMGYAGAPPAAAAAGGGEGDGAGDAALRLYVQVGAFSDAVNAERMRERLRGLGFADVVVHRGSPPEPAYRVRVGPFSDVRSYDRIMERMRLANITDTFLTAD